MYIIRDTHKKGEKGLMFAGINNTRGRHFKAIGNKNNVLLKKTTNNCLYKIDLF